MLRSETGVALVLRELISGGYGTIGGEIELHNP
jgi:hypothetical protein